MFGDKGKEAGMGKGKDKGILLLNPNP